jgi:hypothetical protein
MIIALKQPRNLATSQQRIHTLQECRVQNVGFIEDEAHPLAIAARPLQQGAQVRVKVSERVPPRGLDLRVNEIQMKVHMHTHTHINVRKSTAIAFLAPLFCLSSDDKLNKGDSMHSPHPLPSSPAKPTSTDLEHSETFSPRHKAGKNGFASARLAHQEHVAHRLVQHALDTDSVLKDAVKHH